MHCFTHWTLLHLIIITSLWTKYHFPPERTKLRFRDINWHILGCIAGMNGRVAVRSIAPAPAHGLPHGWTYPTVTLLNIIPSCFARKNVPRTRSVKLPIVYRIVWRGWGVWVSQKIRKSPDLTWTRHFSIFSYHISIALPISLETL